ncbi:MAG: hypothetical protein ACI9DG_001910 [Oleispira sp.]|jgi:hypothetical protein
MSPFETAKIDFLQQLTHNEFQFETTLTFIELYYNVTPSAFNNGGIENSAEQNQGSCKIFALAELLNLSQPQVLACFGQHYRDVLATPTIDNHHNLRRILKEGIADIRFDHFPLTLKTQN